MTREEQMQCSGIAADDMPRIRHNVMPTHDVPRTRQSREMHFAFCLLLCCVVSRDADGATSCALSAMMRCKHIQMSSVACCVGRCDGGVAVTRCKTNPDVFDMLVSCADFETFKGGLPVCRRE